MSYLIAAIVLVLAILAYRLLSNSKSSLEESNTSIPGSDLYLSTSGESEARANKALPSEGSEDVSHLLEALDIPKIDPFSKEDRDYLPEEATEWVITATFSEGTLFTPDQIKSLFDESWDERYGSPTLFGYDPSTKFWTYVFAGDGPSEVAHLKFAWDYYASWNDEELATESDFRDRYEAVKKQLSNFSPESVSTTKDPKEARLRSENLKTAHTKLSQDAVIILQAPKGKLFDGRDIWDSMLSLGLRWGDMDLFHWNNEGEIGGDSHFSVWTSTSPGYFFPEHIAANKVHTVDLAFGFSIPRSAAPEKIYNSMYQSAQYCQKRMGGTLIDKNGSPLDFDKSREELQSIVRQLKELGFEPGASSTLHLF